MAMIDVPTARYFQEDRKSVHKWITECITKAYELSEEFTIRYQ